MNRDEKESDPMNAPPVLSYSQSFIKTNIAVVTLGVCLPAFIIGAWYADLPHPRSWVHIVIIAGGGSIVLPFIPIVMSIGIIEYVFKEDGFLIKERQAHPFSLVRNRVKEFVWEDIWAWWDLQGIVPMGRVYRTYTFLTKQGNKIKIDDLGEKQKYNGQKVEYDKFIKHLYKYLAPLENHQGALWEEIKKMRWLGYFFLFLGVAATVSLFFFVVVGLIYDNFEHQVIFPTMIGAVVCLRLSRNYLRR